MKVEQVSVFLENKAGRLSEVTGILAESDVSIRALALADTSDFGVLRLIVDKHQDAVEVLKDNGFTVATTEVVAVRVEDKPGGLHRILELLKVAGINVEYMYAFVTQSGRDAMMIFRFDNQDLAIKRLAASGVTIVDREQLAAL